MSSYSQYSKVLDVKKLIDLFQQNSYEENKIKDQDIILLVGSTGSGKSTTANYLIGSDLYQKEIDYIDIIDGEEMELSESVIASENGKFLIGHTKESHTQSLQIEQLQDSLYLCDSPGFFDNRSEEIEIANASTLNKFMSTCKSVRMVVLISFDQLTAQRGSSFQEISELLTRILQIPDEEKFKKILFLLTKVPKDKKQGQINKEILEIRKMFQNKEDLNDDQKNIITSLLSVILQQVQKNKELMIVNPLTRNYQDLINKILEQAPFNNPSQDFSFTISKKSTFMINQFLQETQNQISRLQSDGEYKYIIKLIQNVKQLCDCVGQTYLQLEFQKMQQKIGIQLQEKCQQTIQIFKESAEYSIIFNSENMKNINDIISHLKIIDEYKNLVLISDYFRMDESTFKQEIENVCCEMIKTILVNFPNDMQKVQKQILMLKEFIENTSLAQEVYEQQLKTKIQVKYREEQDAFKQRIDKMYEKPSFFEINQKKLEINQIASNLEFFEKIEKFLGEFIVEINQNISFTVFIQQIEQKNQELFDKIQKFIDLNQQKEELEMENFDESLPDFELQMIKMLSEDTLLYKYGVKCEELYQEALQSLQNCIQQIISIITQQNLINQGPSKIKTIFDALNKIKNLDDLIQIPVIEQLQPIKNQINSKIEKKANQARDILKQYSQELEIYQEDSRFLDEQGKIAKQLKQRKDFNKLKEIYNFNKKILCLNSQLNNINIQKTIDKIVKKLSIYFDNIKQNIEYYIQQENLLQLEYFISQMSYFMIFKDFLENNEERYDSTLNIINQKLIKKMNDIKGEFQKMKDQKNFNFNDWDSLNQNIIFLKKIDKLSLFDDIKKESKEIIQNITSFLDSYYCDNIKQIKQISQQFRNNQIDYSKYEQFIQQSQQISDKFQDVEQLFTLYSYQKLGDEVKQIFYEISSVYQNIKQQSANLQEIQNYYDSLKNFVDKFKQFNLISEFRNISSPQETIQESFKKVKEFLRNQDFVNLEYEIEILDKIKSDQNQNSLNDTYQKIFEIVCENINSLQDQFSLKNLNFESIEKQIKNISVIVKILRKYNPKLHDKIQEKLTSFLVEFKEKYLKIQKKNILSQITMFKFNQMEQKNDEIKSYIRRLNCLQNVIENKQEWENNIKSQVENFDEQIKKQINSLCDNLDMLKLQNLKYHLHQTQQPNSDFQETYISLLDTIQDLIKMKFETYYEEIQQKISREEFSFQNQFKLLKLFVSSEEKIDLEKDQNYSERLKIIESNINDFEEKQIQEIQKRIKINPIEAQEIIKNFKEKHILFFYKIIQSTMHIIQNKVDYIINKIKLIPTKEFQLELELITNSIQVIEQFCAGKSQIQQIDDQKSNLIKNFSQFFTKSIEQLQSLLNQKEQQFTQQSVQGLLKVIQQIQIVENNKNFNQNLEQLKEQQNNLDNFLENLGKQIYQLIKIQDLISQKKVNSEQINLFKKFDQFIVILQNKENQYQQLSQITEIILKLKSYDKLIIQLKIEYSQIQNQFDLALKNSQFKKVKEIMNQIYNFQQQNCISSENIVQYKQLLTQIENKIQKIKNKIKQQLEYNPYDAILEELVNQIKEADKNLIGIPEYKYLTQIQQIQDFFKGIISKIFYEIQNIKSSEVNFYKDKFIQIQKHSVNMKIFISVINEQLQKATFFIKNQDKKLFYDLASVLKEDSDGQKIIAKINLFNSYRIEMFNQTVNQHSHEYILRETVFNGKIKDKAENIKSQMKDDYLRFKSFYDEEIDKFRQQEKNLKVIQTDINNLKKQKKYIKDNIIQLLAYICAYWSLDSINSDIDQNGKLIFKSPHCSQIFSIFMVLGFYHTKGALSNIKDWWSNNKYSQDQNILIEMLTGQGKSLILGFSSLILALLGYEIDVICYSQYLSDRDRNSFNQYFTLFEVDKKIFYGNIMQLANRQLNIEINIRDSTLNIIQGNQPKTEENKNNNKDKKILLIDEVDVFFNPDFYGQTYEPAVSFICDEIKIIIKKIWQIRSIPEGDIVKNIFVDNIYKDLIKKYPKFENLFKRHIQQLAKDVQNIQNHHKEYQYIVLNERIGYRQVDSSFNFETSIGYKTLFAYFYENQKKKISDQTLESKIELTLGCGSISYALLPNEYATILGVTGTLQNLNKERQKNIEIYNIKNGVQIPSMFGKSNLDFKNTVIEKDYEEQYLKIKEVCKEAQENDQPVLIFFKNSQLLDKYYNSAYLIQNNQYMIIKSYIDDLALDSDIKQATQARQISLILKEHGRGIDFASLDPRVNRQGGVVVIQTFLSEDKTEEIQIQGRTARQGSKGQYYLILNQIEIQQQLNVSDNDIKQWKNCIYEKLDQKRNQLEDEKYRQIEKKILQARAINDKSMKYYSDIIKNQKEAIKFINEYS